jgi:tetratricopeptide (TPR) repeat protein
VVDCARSGVVLKLGDSATALTLARQSVAGFEAEGDKCGAAVVHIRLSEFAEGRGDYEEAAASLRFAYDAFMEFGSQAFNASTLATRLGNLAAAQDRFEEATTWHKTALERARERTYPGAIAQALSGIGVAAFRKGDLDEAAFRHAEALEVFTSSGSVEGVSFTLTQLGLVARARGDATTAIDLGLRSLERATSSNDRRAVALAVEGLAGAHAVREDFRRAAVLLGAARELRDKSGWPRSTAESRDVEDTEEQLLRALGAPDFRSAFEAGAQDHETILAELVTESLGSSAGRTGTQ